VATACVTLAPVQMTAAATISAERMSSN
jgi:hypothetical protein